MEETSNSQTVNDLNFVYHYDNPRMIFISQILNNKNYASSSRSMKIALSAKNKFEFIDRTLPQLDNSNPERLKLWQQNRNIMISWILSVVSKEISASIIYFETAADMWKELGERFQQSNRLIIFQIRSVTSR